MPNVQLTWLGHATFRFDTPDGKRVYVDPWLSNPKIPENEKEPERVDLIALTHGHGDHLGETIELSQKHSPVVVAPVELADWLVGVKEAVTQDNIRDPNKGGTVDVDGLKVTLTHAQHSSSIWDDNHIQYTGEPVGLVFDVGGTKIYFAGDTNVFGDMQLIKRLYEPDVAVLPIGGHFTMDPKEAAVALEFLGASKCIPCHYGTFPLLAGTPDQLRELAPSDVEIVEMQPGETVEV